VEIYTRRTLLWTAAAADALRAQTPAPERKMRLGIIIGINRQPDAAIQRVHDLGFPTCQLSVHDSSEDRAARSTISTRDR
jgi:hypothetical protein